MAIPKRVILKGSTADRKQDGVIIMDKVQENIKNIESFKNRIIENRKDVNMIKKIQVEMFYEAVEIGEAQDFWDLIYSDDTLELLIHNFISCEGLLNMREIIIMTFRNKRL